MSINFTNIMKYKYMKYKNKYLRLKESIDHQASILPNFFIDKKDMRFNEYNTQLFKYVDITPFSLKNGTL